jgi:cobalt-zinc-cadmium efflux system outer membrane protein
MSLNEQLKTIKALLGLEVETLLEIEDRHRTTPSPQNMSLGNLIETALDNRPDIKLSKLQTQYFEKSLSYEKAQRIPDLTFSIVYDRYGSTWKDFWGFGLSIDLPILNLNQGNIKIAQISQKQSQYMARQQENQARHEIAEFFKNYSQAYDFYNKIDISNLSTEFDNMLEVYAKNFLNRNISMLEYIDFMDTCKSNKQILLSAKKNLNIQLEELQHKIGLDIKQ